MREEDLAAFDGWPAVHCHAKTPSAARVVRTAFMIAGRPVVLRAFATFAAVGLPAAVVFSPQGLDARDLVRALQDVALLRAVVWIGWLALSAHATNAVFTAPGMTALRAARPRRAHVLVVLFALTSFAQLPWAVLWLRGSGPIAALGAVTVTVASASSAFVLTRRRRRLSAVVLALALASAVAGLPPLLQAIVGCVLSLVAIDGAWRVALEHRMEARIWTRPGAPSVVALTTVHLLRLARAERLRLTFATMLHGLGAAGLLTLRSEPAPRPLERALAIMAVPLVLGSALFVAPLVDCERAMNARLRALRVRRWAVVAAFLLAIAVPTSAFAATAGAIAGIASDVSPISLSGVVGSWAILLSGTVGAWGRYHARTKTRSPILFATGVVGIALFTVMIAMELP